MIAKAAKSTLGPFGANSCIDYELGPPKMTKDGVTVVKNIRS